MMGTIFKYLLIAVAFYCTVNWLADNPNILPAFRDKMNELIGVSIDKTKELVEENKSESG